MEFLDFIPFIKIAGRNCASKSYTGNVEDMVFISTECTGFFTVASVSRGSLNFFLDPVSTTKPIKFIEFPIEFNDFN